MIDLRRSGLPAGVALLLSATAAFGAGSGLAQTTSPEAGADLNAVPTHPDASVPRPALARHRERHPRSAAPGPSTAAADLAKLRQDEAIVHGATSATQAPTTNSGYTGGPELRGDVLKSGATGPQ